MSIEPTCDFCDAADKYRCRSQEQANKCKNKTIEIKQWWAPGNGMMYNVYGLDPDHEMHPYQQALNQGVIPEKYDIFHPYNEEFKDLTRTELLAKVVELRRENAFLIKELNGAAKHGMY